MLLAIGAPFWSAAAVLSAVDAQWATPVNTFLLLVTLIVGVMLNRKASRTESKIDRNHQTTVDAASASASAAESAATSARITRELGSHLRQGTSPGGDIPA